MLIKKTDLSTVKDILFIHLPRTGGTTISIEAKNASNLHYYRPSHTPAKNIAHLTQCFLFGFIRNPWDWYVSRYLYFCYNRHPKMIEEGLSKESDAGLVGDQFQQRFFSLKDHLLFGLQQNQDNFWLSWLYNYMFYSNDGILLLDYIGKFEQWQDEINSVFIKANIADEYLLTLHKNTTKHTHYSNYYDQEMIDLIYQKDRKIIKEYGYEF